MYILFLIVLLFVNSPAWAFPDNGVLDNFTGCVDNTTPPNSNWTNAVLQGASSANVRCRSAGITSATGGTEADAYWNAASFGAGCEAYAKISDDSGTNDIGTVYCRLVNIGANTTDGYAVYWDDTNSQVGIGRIDNGAYSEITSVVSQTIATGDQFGIKTVGDQICAWYKVGAGAWTEIGCRTDGTYGAGGNIGVSIAGDTTLGIMDDFGGGTVTSTRRPIAPLLLGWLWNFLTSVMEPNDALAY